VPAPIDGLTPLALRGADSPASRRSHGRGGSPSSTPGSATRRRAATPSFQRARSPSPSDAEDAVLPLPSVEPVVRQEADIMCAAVIDGEVRRLGVGLPHEPRSHVACRCR
jgi:hypothetical protein